MSGAVPPSPLCAVMTYRATVAVLKQ
jgi:hypothetical protein